MEEKETRQTHGVKKIVLATVIAVALYLVWYVWYWTQHRNSRKVRRSHPD